MLFISGAFNLQLRAGVSLIPFHFEPNKDKKIGATHHRV